MKKLNGLFLFLIFFSCHYEKKIDGLKTDSLKKASEIKSTLGYSTKKDSTLISTGDSTKKDSTLISTGDSTLFEPGAPEITPLPFGLKPDLKNFRYTESYFIAMLSQNKSGKLYQHTESPQAPLKNLYKLPPIKSIEYITLPMYRLIDTGVCNDGKSFGDYINLKGYRYRLPDIYNYQCYYDGGFRNPNHDKEYGYSRNVFQNCAVFINDYEYGYFILYDPKTLTAKVITIYFDSEYDALITYRFFYIDKAYNIQVYDGSINPELHSKPTHLRLTTFSILPNGEIHRKRN